MTSIFHSCSRSGQEVYNHSVIHATDPMKEANQETNLFANRRRLKTADRELITSILDGKGDDMPGFPNVLTYEEAENVLSISGVL